ncbi:hypothetical protein BS17DRAFT_105572 [Gyrodon lividus]|nr:hypothetical protein BS17DRAFT_105572 [Gyrodon lividus]
MSSKVSHRGDDGMVIDDKHDIPLHIPDFARAWNPSVRRPSKLPDKRLYHDVIEPQAIFELDQEREDGSKQPILVVPYRCDFCANVAKTPCSRAWPACKRCRDAGRSSCKPGKGGYVKLPGPKIPRLPNNASRIAAASQSPQSGSSQSQVSRTSEKDGRPGPGSSKSTPSKRPVSPETVVTPRKKMQIKTAERKGKALRKSNEPSEVVVVEANEGVVPESQSQPHFAVPASEGTRSGPKWTFIKGSRGRDESLTVMAQDEPTLVLMSSAPTPRVWTNSRVELLTMFPELAKALTGISWLQSETPILVLETNHPEDHWLCSTTLNINLPRLWDFSCNNLDLEPSDTHVTSQSPGPGHHPRQPEVHPENSHPTDTTVNNVFHEDEMMVAANSPPCFSPLIPGQNLQDSQNIDLSGSAISSLAPVGPLQYNDTGMFSTPCPSGNLLLKALPAPNNSSISSPPPRVRLPQSVPLIQPPDIQTLLDSRARLAPLLIWLSRDCKLMPCTTSPDCTYSCLGFFFIANLRHEVIKHAVSSTTGTMQVQGRVRWHVTLEWAPGGEEALFSDDAGLSSPEMVVDNLTPLDSRRNLSHPWWLNSTESDVTSTGNTASPYRPRDLRMHYYSYLPLDLLADFHPSESFPRGWFCRKCGMINAQMFFRHQICQSSACKSISHERTCQGKIDPLSKLRDSHHSHILTHPVDNPPSFLQSTKRSWDDGMQSWTYLVNYGVSLQHVFTGNQENIQTEATALLEGIQCDVLLSKEDPSSPYFMHTTVISNSNDTLGITIPTGMPARIHCVYHALVGLVTRYGGLDKPRFGEILIQAWVTAGSKRGKVFRAKTSPVVILCLGAEVILNFTPKAGYGNASKTTTTITVTGEDDRSVLSMERPPESAQNSGDQVEQRPFNSQSKNAADATPEHVVKDAVVADLHPSGYSDGSAMHPGLGSNMPFSPPGASVVILSKHKDATEPKQRRGRKKSKGKNRNQAPEVSMTLVHGDGVILTGDDFECQIVRTGTTILVIGSSEGT